MPNKMHGVCLNSDGIKHSGNKLTEVLRSLKHDNIVLNNTVKRLTLEMAEQDKLLWVVSQISKKLLQVQANEKFENRVYDCLYLLGESIDKNRVYVWKDHINTQGITCCTQIYELVRDAEPIQGNTKFEDILYEDMPSFEAAINNDKCLNSLIRELSDSEKRILGSQNIKTILIAPIVFKGKRWGFIGVDNCESEQLFTSVEENMLMMSGSMLAIAIEKMETEAKLREMEDQTQIVLNSTPLCCNLWNSDFQNMICNDEAVRLFELSSQKEYLERFNELSPKYQLNGKRSQDLAIEYISKAFQEGYLRFEWMHQKLDGTSIPAEITLVRIKYKKDFIVAGYTRDLREQKAMIAEIKLKDTLRTARDEALLNSQAKSNFLANMSHEIRTPMNAISGFAEIILWENVNEKTAEYARKIKGACDNLINIINDILDISKIESGKLEIINAPYELSSLINDVITISRMRLGNKPLMFITDIDSHLPAHLVGDEIRIKQILLNMLSNAIKYTREGYIELRISGTVEKNKAILNFSVQDSGAGIKAEDIEHLFEEFERVNTTRNRSIEGTGLGLPIAKQLCEMMDGYIKVESTYGKGSTFSASISQDCPFYERLSRVEQQKNVLLYESRQCYRLSIVRTLENLGCKCISCANQSELYNSIDTMPYDYIFTAALHLEKVQSKVWNNNMSVPVAAFADYGETVSDNMLHTILFPVNCLQISALLNGQHKEESTAQQNETSSNFVAPSARVLIVDDNPLNLQVAKGLMEPYQFEIDTAENGMEAISSIKNREYDLVFMDHMMPQMDGVDTTLAIRKLEEQYYRNLPIIALTANTLVGTREMFIHEGMNDFLAKPIEVKKLAHILVKWLPQSKVMKSMSQTSAAEMEKIQEWYIAGVDTVKGIMSIGGSKENYLRILSAYYEEGRPKCSTLLQHIMKKDIAAFRIEVHALKSTSATIGASEVSWRAAKLEKAAQNNDISFITSNIDEFLVCFQAVLEAIAPVLRNNQPIPLRTELVEDKADGETANLGEILHSLNDAVDFANISLIEEEFSKLQKFTWTEEITGEIMMMQKYLNMFDYDGIHDCIMRLKESL